MDIKLKRLSKGKVIKIKANNSIKEILISEDMMNPDKEKINICFRGNNNSGIIELNHSEAQRLVKSLTNKLKIIKDIKIIDENAWE